MHHLIFDYLYRTVEGGSRCITLYIFLWYCHPDESHDILCSYLLSWFIPLLLRFSTPPYTAIPRNHFFTIICTAPIFDPSYTLPNNGELTFSNSVSHLHSHHLHLNHCPVDHPMIQAHLEGASPRHHHPHCRGLVGPNHSSNDVDRESSGKRLMNGSEISHFTTGLETKSQERMRMRMVGTKHIII